MGQDKKIRGAPFASLASGDHPATTPPLPPQEVGYVYGELPGYLAAAEDHIPSSPPPRF